jgi:methionine-rich copper-binding protein CopC
MSMRTIVTATHRAQLRVVILGAVVLVIALISPTFAAAHTSVVKTIPQYQSTLTEMVDEVSIEFTDELLTFGEEKVNTIEVSGPNGLQVAISQLLISGNIIIAKLAGDDYQDGTYLVEYRVVSADGHPVSGSYELYLNKPSTGNAPSTTLTSTKHESFIHIHKTHLIWAALALLPILAWGLYRRFKGEIQD